MGGGTAAEPLHDAANPCQTMRAMMNLTLGCLDASGFGQKPNGRSEKCHGQKASTQTASLE